MLLAAALIGGCEALPQAAAPLPTMVFVPPATPTLSADRVYTVARGRIQDIIKTRGSVASAQETLLAFKTAGYLKQIDIREGDTVEKDAVLAVLDTEGAGLEPLQDAIVDNGFELKLKTLEIAQAKSEPIEMDILSAKTALKQVEVKLQQAQAAYDKVAWQGDASAAGSEAFALQAAHLAMESAQAAYNAAVARQDPQGLKIQYLETQAAFAKAKLDRAQARLALAQEETLLKAPFSGVIVAVQKKLGDAVEPYAPIGTLADPSQIRVVATVLEADMARLKFGLPVSITLDANSSQQFTGKVTGLSSQPTTWQGRNAFPATVEFDDPTVIPATMRMGADISILARQVDRALLVPAEAIKTDGERKYVEVMNSPTADATRIEIGVGLTDGPLTEVLWGLSEGDQVKIR
jgi:HlyD family secretion protein